MKKLVFFGDSLTSAGRDESHPTDLGHGFVPKICRELSQDWEAVNCGFNAYYIVDLIFLLSDPDIKQHIQTADQLFLLIGINNIWSDGDEPEEIWETREQRSVEQFETLLKEIQTLNPQLEIVVGLPFALFDLPIYRDRLPHYQAALQQVAIHLNHLVIDLTSVLEPLGEEAFTWDNVHLSNLGNHAIAERLIPILGS